MVSKAVEKWLMEEALPNNSRVHIDAEGKLSYKPPYSLKGGRTAIRLLLENNYKDGKGGVNLSDLNDSIPAAELNVKNTPDVIDIPTAVGLSPPICLVHVTASRSNPP